MADVDREASKAALARNAAVVAGRTGRALVVPAVAAALAVAGGVFTFIAFDMMDGMGNNPELAIQASTALLYAAVALWSVAAVCVTVDIAVTRLARRPQRPDA